MPGYFSQRAGSGDKGPGNEVAMAAEQMTAMNRKRERDDKIGKLMGEYLLKGYKMLGSTCTVCGTILLKDRKQQDYCIGCSEVDEEFHAAPTTYQKTTTVVVCDTSNDINSQLTEQISHESQVKDEMPHRQQGSSTASSGPSSNQCLDDATIKLHERITWATSQLGCSNSVEMDIKLSELICSCGQAIKTLKTLQKS